jgi:hypothetical protein
VTQGTGGASASGEPTDGAVASQRADRVAGARRDQLDLFADSRDVALRNDLAVALLRGDAPAARRVADELARDFGGDPVLEPAATLIEELERRSRTPADACLDAARIVGLRAATIDRLAPAARAVLGNDDADGWLVAHWQRLARHAAGVAWHVDDADAHAASLYVEARAWAQAAAAVETIASWRRIPQPLAWMTLARWHTRGADAGWPLLAETFWLAPQRAQALIASLPDERLRRFARRFEDGFDVDAHADWAWFPAWMLIEQPLLAGVLDTAQRDAGGAPVLGFDLVRALLRLERQGRHHELVEHRRRLQAASARLFTAYMRTR